DEAHRLGDLCARESPGRPETVTDRSAGQERKAEHLTESIGDEGAEDGAAKTERTPDVTQGHEVVARQDGVREDGKGKRPAELRRRNGGHRSHDATVGVRGELAMKQGDG